MATAGLLAGDELLQVGPLMGQRLTRRTILAQMAKGEAHAWTVLRNGRRLELAYPRRAP